MAKHIPVLSEKVLQAFENRQIETFLDGTLGLGGHSRLLLEAHPELKTLSGIDQDPEALRLATENLKNWEEKFRPIRGNFSQMDSFFTPGTLDGILLDIGVSSMQLDQAARGFSFQKDGPLDMRMDPEGEVSAYDVVNFWSEKDLCEIFQEYGEERNYKKAAKAIVEGRRKKKIQTTQELVDLLMPHLNAQPKIHPATRIFQAIRIVVNRELDVLTEVIPKAISLLSEKGRLLIITFHSLEDRIVKWAFKEQEKLGAIKIITKKPLEADFLEARKNPRSRSAKLRIVEKI